MSHARVNRVAAALTVGFLAAALGFGWFVSRDRYTGGAQEAPSTSGAVAEPAPANEVLAGPGTASGPAIFEHACSACHTREALTAGDAGSGDPVARAARLGRFLEGHGGVSVEEAHVVADWLVGHEAAQDSRRAP